MSAFALSSGTLRCIPNGNTCSPFLTTGNAPYTLAAVSTKFLYAGIPASQKGGVINRVLNLPLTGPATGGIMLMPIKTGGALDTPQMFASGGDYDPIAVTPNGNFLYAADLTSNQLAAFSIDGSKGTLTAIASQGPPIGVGPDPFNVAIDPQGKFVFVANCDCTSPGNQGSVSVFSINSDGTLHAVGKFPIGGAVSAQPSALAVSPDGKFLFIASLDDEVYVKTIDGTTGVLADPATTSPSVSLPVAGSKPISIVVSVDGGNSLYIGNAGTHTISFFLNCVQTPAPSGCPTGNPPPPLAFQSNTAVGGAVGVIVPDPGSTTTTSGTTTTIAPGHFLYVTDYEHGPITVFSVTSTTSCTTPPCTPIPGTLTQSGTPVNTGGVNPVGLAIAH